MVGSVKEFESVFADTPSILREATDDDASLTGFFGASTFFCGSDFTGLAGFEVPDAATDFAVLSDFCAFCVAPAGTLAS